MSTTEGTVATTALPGPHSLDLRVEVVVAPVMDVDRSGRFDEQLGWRRFDTELAAQGPLAARAAPDVRVVASGSWPRARTRRT